MTVENERKSTTFLYRDSDPMMSFDVIRPCGQNRAGLHAGSTAILPAIPRSSKSEVSELLTLKQDGCFVFRLFPATHEPPRERQSWGRIGPLVHEEGGGRSQKRRS